MPTTDPNALFGRLVTRRDVELAAVSFLQTWVPTYVAELERQGGLAPQTVPLPPDPNLSYRGGLDFDTWEPAWSPVFIVVAQPTGAPQRADGAGNYLQTFSLNVGVNFQFSGATMPSLGVIEEDSARQYADILGMAACAAMLQHGGLGNWADGSFVALETWMTEYPKTSFPFADERRITRCQFTLMSVVQNVVTEAAGPKVPAGNPYASPPDLPLVTTAPIVVNSGGGSGPTPTPTTGIDGMEISAVPLPDQVPQTT